MSHSPEPNLDSSRWGALLRLGPENPDHWAELDAAAPELEAAAAEIDDPVLVGDLRDLLGRFLWAQGRYEVAAPHLWAAVALGERPETPPEARVRRIGHLAELLLDTGKPNDAAWRFRQALALGDEHLDEANPELATAENNVGYCMWVIGEPREGLPFLRRALRLDLQRLGFKPEGWLDADLWPGKAGWPDPSIARDLNNLGLVLQDLGEPEEAEACHRRALAIDERIFGPDHARVGVDINNLGLLLQRAGRWEEAEALMRRALLISERALGPDHPTLGTRLNNLAKLLFERGRAWEAEIPARRCAEITERRYGPEDLRTAGALDTVVSVYLACRQLADAEAPLRRVIAIREKHLGPEDLDLGRDLLWLAALLKQLERFAQAEPISRRALSLFAKHLWRTGERSPHLYAAERNHEVILRGLGRGEGAIAAELARLNPYEPG